MISHRSKPIDYPDYISPLPADEFLKGVMYKQKMYDEGVALVNKQLDAYQAIRDSLTKEQDRKYFDQEATKFVDALNKKASLDLSVKSNLQSVLQSGNQLVRDPNIKQAAESSATFKKMLEEQSKLDPSKRSHVNDYFFNKDLQAWLNDGKIGSKLNYNPYTVYTDEHVKLWGQLSDKLKPTTVEQPVFSPDGKWIIKNSYTGVDGDRFYKAYMSGLSDQAKNQLRMEAQYALENGDKDAIKNGFITFNQTFAQNLGTKIASTELDRTNAVKKYGNSSPEVLKLDNDLNNLRMAQSIYQENANKPFDQISDQELTKFITDNKLMDASNEWAYEQKKQEIQANPYAADYSKMMNNIYEHEAKIKLNLQYGLDADGKTSTSIPIGDPVNQSDISKTVSGITNNKPIPNLATNVTAGLSNVEQQFLLAGIKSFYGITPDNKSTQTVKDVLKRAMVSGTWNENDRNEILTSMAGKEAIVQSIANNTLDKNQANTILQANKKKAEDWMNYLKKLGSGIYDVYNFQAGAPLHTWANKDATDLANANVTNKLLSANSGLDIPNTNTQSNNANDFKGMITTGLPDKAETFSADGRGLTFVPKKQMIYVIKRTPDNKLVKQTYDIETFLNSDASTLGGIEDIRYDKEN